MVDKILFLEIRLWLDFWRTGVVTLLDKGRRSLPSVFRLSVLVWSLSSVRIITYDLLRQPLHWSFVHAMSIYSNTEFTS
jgi:hypothetical protein